jgi:hypothetical protein
VEVIEEQSICHGNGYEVYRIFVSISISYQIGPEDLFRPRLAICAKMKRGGFHFKDAVTPGRRDLWKTLRGLERFDAGPIPIFVGT